MNSSKPLPAASRTIRKGIDRTLEAAGYATQQNAWAEVISDLLHNPSLQGTELVRKGEKKHEGVGVIEAPRGTLFHHYRINDNDQIVMANLIVSTTNNNEPMNRAVNHVAKVWLTGKKEITEPMTNAIEVAIRAYDPCLSCATHALGQMPLEVSLYDAKKNLIDRMKT